MKSILFSFILLFSINYQLVSQENVLSFKNETLSRRTKKNSYTISNKLNNDLAIVIIERKQIFAHLFNNDFSQKAALKTKNIKPKYNTALGYCIINEEYNILYTNSNRNKFALLTLNFNSGQGFSREISVDLEDEYFIDTINYNNKLYLLSADIDSNLHLKEFNNNSEFHLVKTFSLDEIKENTALISSRFQIGSFVLRGMETANITKIDQRVESSIEQTSNENKMYQKNDSIYLTFDVNEIGTQIYKINLDSYSITLNEIPYPKGKIKDFKKFNSYIYQDKLYQIASSKEEMSFVIKDLKGVFLKEFYITKEKPIDFKNSPIIQEGQTALPFVNKRELEQTRKYLRKITSGNIGLTVLEKNGTYNIKIGGFQYITNNAPVMAVTTNASGGFTGFNTTYLAYNSYTTTKSTYFYSILDASFTHKKGTIKDNVFNKIAEFKLSKNYFTAEDVFFHNNQLYLGYFNLKESQYSLLRF